MNLNCTQARRLAHDFLDGIIEPADGLLLAAHLDHCQFCPPLYTALEAGVSALRQISTEMAGQADNIVAAILHRIQIEPNPPNERKYR